MAYIGNTPADKFLTLAKQSFSTSATTSYTLDSAVSSTQDIALFINNVRQSPVDAYTVSGTALTLTSATAGTDEMYCVYLGKTVGTVSPSTNSVTNDMLSGSIANSKLVNSSITLNGSAVSLGGSASVDNTPSFYAYLGSNQTISNATDTKITLDTEGWDTDSAFASSKFTVPSGEGGKYLFNFSGKTDLAIDTFAYISVRVNNSTVVRSTQGTVKPNATGNALLNSSVIVSLSATDYVELFIYQNSGSAQLAYANYCSLMGCKLIGV